MLLFLPSDTPQPVADCETLTRMTLPQLLYHILVERLAAQPLHAHAA